MENNIDSGPLSEEEIIKNLTNLPGWTHTDGKIGKTFIFKSFDDGIKLVDTLAPFCNEIDHHPDICIYYKKINFTLTTHDVGSKVTKLDFTIAKKIEEIYSEMYKGELS